MTGPIETALVAAAAEDSIVWLNALGDPADVAAELVAVAATPLAPLAATALAAALAAPDGAVWAPAATAFTVGLTEQASVLALAETVDVLLERQVAASATAAALHKVAVDAVVAAASAAPQLAVVWLETALRIALAGAVPAFAVLDLLTSTADGFPDDYTEALPRLIGAALDAWDGDRLVAPLVDKLELLVAHPAAGPDAMFELACHRMRTALRMEEPDAAVAGLSAACDGFSAAAAEEEARDDAAVYAEACAAIAAFAAGDGLALAEHRDRLTITLARRQAWHRNTHVPAWRRPVLDSEVEWLALVVDLSAATDRLADRSWLDTTAAIGQVLRVYIADRTTTPAPGLMAIVRPAVENAVAANATLLDQLARAIEADLDRAMPVLPPETAALHAAIRNRTARPRDPRRPSDADATEGETARPADARVVPPLLRILGDDVAADLAQRLPPDRIAELTDLLTGASVTCVGEDPTLRLIRKSVVDDLEANVRFADSETRGAVILLLDHTLRFLHDRYNRNGPMWTAGPNPTRLLTRGEATPHEKELQQEFYYWLANSAQFAARVRMEVSDVAGGRVDVIARVREIELITEIKRELDDPTPASLHQYVPQAAQYAGAGVPFSQLLVLDLTDHSHGWPLLPDLVWTVEHRPSAAASPVHVVVGVVIGNKPTPRQLTTASDGQ